MVLLLKATGITIASRLATTAATASRASRAWPFQLDKVQVTLDVSVDTSGNGLTIRVGLWHCVERNAS